MEKHGVSHTEDSPEYQLAGLPLGQRLICLPISDPLSFHKRKPCGRYIRLARGLTYSRVYHAPGPRSSFHQYYLTQSCQLPSTPGVKILTLFCEGQNSDSEWEMEGSMLCGYKLEKR